MTATARRGEMVIWGVRYKVSKFLVQKRYSGVTKWHSERPFRKGFIYVRVRERTAHMPIASVQWSPSFFISFFLSFTLCFASPLHRAITNRSEKEPRQRLYRNFTQRKRRRRERGEDVVENEGWARCACARLQFTRHSVEFLVDFVPRINLAL